MEEELWIVGQQARVVADRRADLRAVWDDEAAREISGRYLAPHEEDDQTMRRAFNEQDGLLREAAHRSAAGLAFAAEAEGLSGQLAALFEGARQDEKSAYAHLETCARFVEDAREKMAAAAELLKRADNACD
jgi:hypothetical protein